MELLETWITTPRVPRTTLSQVVDLLFLQCYKSFSGVYILAVSGQGEDAGTVARRLLELTWQLMALNSSSQERHQEDWAKRCLAYFFGFWPQMKGTVAVSWTDEERNYWEQAYLQNSHLIEFDQYDWPLNWWPRVDSDGNITTGRGGFIHLATLAGARDSYENDYRVLSQMAHGLASGFLFEMSRGKIEIRSGRMAGALVLWATSYVLIAASVWNAHFPLFPEEKLTQLRDEVLLMKKQLAERSRREV